MAAEWMTVTDSLVPICPHCLKSTKFGYLVLREIIKTVATRCGRNAPNSISAAAAADPAGPDPLAGICMVCTVLYALCSASSRVTACAMCIRLLELCEMYIEFKTLSQFVTDKMWKLLFNINDF